MLFNFGKCNSLHTGSVLGPIVFLIYYIKNKIGPNTDPCGTQLKTDFQFETSPSATTLCLYPVKHTISYAMGLIELTAAVSSIRYHHVPYLVDRSKINLPPISRDICRVCAA